MRTHIHTHTHTHTHTHKMIALYSGCRRGEVVYKANKTTTITVSAHAHRGLPGLILNILDNHTARLSIY